MTNKFIIGRGDKTPHLDTKPGFLLIDDGPIADLFLEKYSRAKEFDPHTHSFNPLPMDERQARAFADIVFGDAGRDTLTVRNGKRALARLVTKAKRLDQIVPGKGDDEKEAAAAIDDLLFSPLMRKILCDTENKFSFRAGRSSVVARLDRADIGDHDARILGALLISRFKGQIILPDFGFYARPFHDALIREKRLIAGVYTLSELDKELRQMCLLMEKTGTQCTWDDACELAKYDCIHPPHTEGYDTFIKSAMRPV
jgi:hypothetical protein